MDEPRDSSNLPPSRPTRLKHRRLIVGITVALLLLALLWFTGVLGGGADGQPHVDPDAPAAGIIAD